MTFSLTNEKAYAVFYTVIKHDGKAKECRIDEPQASVFYISRVSFIVWSVLSQSNTRLRLLHLLYDVEVMWRKTIKTLLYVLSSDKTSVFGQSEGAQDPIYILINFNRQGICYAVNIL